MKSASVLAQIPRAIAAALATLALLAAPAYSQQQEIPKTTAESICGILSYTEDQFFSTAEAMPAGKYSYIPSAPGGKFDGVRSFAEQVKHVACASTRSKARLPLTAARKAGPRRRRPSRSF
jgi:hypothetical protein